MSQFKLIPITRNHPLQIRKTVQSLNQDLIISTQTRYFLVKQKDIIYVQGQGNYAKIYVKQRRPIMVSKPLVYYQQQLSPQDFIRIHQSYLINKNEVVSVDRNGQELSLVDGSHFPISRRLKKQVFIFFGITEK